MAFLKFLVLVEKLSLFSHSVQPLLAFLISYPSWHILLLLAVCSSLLFPSIQAFSPTFYASHLLRGPSGARFFACIGPRVHITLGALDLFDEERYECLTLHYVAWHNGFIRFTIVFIRVWARMSCAVVQLCWFTGALQQHLNSSRAHHPCRWHK